MDEVNKISIQSICTRLSLTPSSAHSLPPILSARVSPPSPGPPKSRWPGRPDVCLGVQLYRMQERHDKGCARRSVGPYRPQVGGSSGGGHTFPWGTPCQTGRGTCRVPPPPALRPQRPPLRALPHPMAPAAGPTTRDGRLVRLVLCALVAGALLPGHRPPPSGYHNPWVGGKHAVVFGIAVCIPPISLTSQVVPTFRKTSLVFGPSEHLQRLLLHPIKRPHAGEGGRVSVEQDGQTNKQSGGKPPKIFVQNDCMIMLSFRFLPPPDARRHSPLWPAPRGLCGPARAPAPARGVADWSRSPIHSYGRAPVGSFGPHGVPQSGFRALNLSEAYLWHSLCPAHKTNMENNAFWWFLIHLNPFARCPKHTPPRKWEW